MLVNLIVFHIGNPYTGTTPIVNLVSWLAYYPYSDVIFEIWGSSISLILNLCHYLPYSLHSSCQLNAFSFVLLAHIFFFLAYTSTYHILCFQYGMSYPSCTQHSCGLGVIQTSRHRIPFKSLIHEDQATLSTYYLFFLWSVFLGIHMLIFLRVVSCLNLGTNFHSLHDTLNSAVWSWPSILHHITYNELLHVVSYCNSLVPPWFSFMYYSHDNCWMH